MGKQFVNRSGKIRLYDGSGTPQFLELDFDAGDFSGPKGRARPEEILKLNRGKIDADAHYISGPEDKIMEPLELSFSAFLTSLDQSGYLEDWLKAMNDGGTTTVNAKTLVTTKGTTQNDGVNNNPAFADSEKMACNLEILWSEDVDKGMQYNEVYFPLDADTITEAEDGNNLSITGFIYGTIEDITAFTSGASVET